MQRPSLDRWRDQSRETLVTSSLREARRGLTPEWNGTSREEFAKTLYGALYEYATNQPSEHSRIIGSWAVYFISCGQRLFCCFLYPARSLQISRRLPTLSLPAPQSRPSRWTRRETHT